MNELSGDDLLDAADLEQQIVQRDRQVDNNYTMDEQSWGSATPWPTSATT